MILFIALSPLAGCAHAGSLAPSIGGPSNIGSPVNGGAAAAHGTSSGTRQNAAPAHVLTWVNIGMNGGTTKVGPAQLANIVNYTTIDQPDSIIAHSLGMKTVIYTDPNRTGPGDIMHTQIESTYAHDCKNNRIAVIGKNKQLMDVHSNKLWAEWGPAVLTMISWNGGGIYDYIFEDTADSINNLKASPCHFDQKAWTKDTNNMDSALGMPIFYNGLSHIGSGSTQPAVEFQLNPTTSGGEAEECYIGRTPSGYHYAPYWLGMENTEIGMAAQGKLFDCHGTVFTQASTNASIALRTYYYASYLLTYDQNTTISETEFLTPSGVTVMPEQQLVPEQPLVPTPSSIDGLMQPSGVYGREYAACYLAGTSIGPCAVAVNPNNPHLQSLAFPWPGKYKHTLTMSGSGLYDGGTVGTNGPPPPANMGGATGVIALP